VHGVADQEHTPLVVVQARLQHRQRAGVLRARRLERGEEHIVVVHRQGRGGPDLDDPVGVFESGQLPQQGGSAELEVVVLLVLVQDVAQFLAHACQPLGTGRRDRLPRLLDLLGPGFALRRAELLGLEMS